jgi:H+/Cl- antiporter ClcA
METPFRRDLDATAFLPASLAALIAFRVHAFLVDGAPMLPFTNAGQAGWTALGASVLVGLAAGLLSRLFTYGALRAKAATDPLPWQLRGPLGGLVVAGTALLAWAAFGDTWTLQTGLPMARLMLAGQFHGWTALALLALKLVAVWATLGTTGVAGVLVISLTVGSVLGAALQPLLPFTPELACAVAVCAYLAANYNAPLTGMGRGGPAAFGLAGGDHRRLDRLGHGQHPRQAAQRPAANGGRRHPGAHGLAPIPKVDL